MSKCISAKGEYSEHAPGEEEEFVCGRCYVVDEEAMRAEIERLRADRPSVTDNARANSHTEAVVAEADLWLSAHRVSETWRTMNRLRDALVRAAGRAETSTECRYGGPEGPACWNIGACGCRVIPESAETTTTDTTKETDR